MKKVLDNRAGILYNKDRSEEERKTLGPTADLPFFKMHGRIYLIVNFLLNVKKVLVNPANLWYNISVERGRKPHKPERERQ